MRRSSARGFTLLELILSLAILAALGAVLFSSLYVGARGFMASRADTATVQRARLALSRMTIELRRLTAISTAEDSRISFTNAAGSQELLLSGSTITLNERLLIADLASFPAGSSLFAYRRSDGATAWTTADDLEDLSEIIITLPLTRTRDPVAGDVTQIFTVTLNPRNTGAANSP